jgi:hypothetical protein
MEWHRSERKKEEISLLAGEIVKGIFKFDESKAILITIKKSGIISLTFYSMLMLPSHNANHIMITRKCIESIRWE